MLALSLAWSALRTRPGRAFVSMVGIALGVATAVAILTLDVVTVLSKTLPRTEEFAKVDLEAMPVDPRRKPADVLAELHGLEGVGAAGAVIMDAVSIVVNDEVRGSCKIIALDDTARKVHTFASYQIADGSDLQSIDSPDYSRCLMGAELASRLKLKVGDSVELQRVQRESRSSGICVDGEMVNPSEGREAPPEIAPARVRYQIAGTLERYHLGRQAGGSVIIAPLSAVDRIFGEAHSPAVYWIGKAKRLSIEDLKIKLTPNFAFSTDRSALVGEAADERAFRNGVRVSGVLALLLGLFVVFHTLSMSLVERVREIAVLNAVGATRAQIGMAFFTEGAVIALLGALLGVGIGLGLAKGALLMGYTTLGRVASVGLFTIPWEPVLAIAGVGFVVALLGSIFPLVKARSILPSRVLSQRELGGDTDVFRGLNIFIFALLAGVMPALYLFAVPLIGETSQEMARVMATGGLLLAVFLGFLLLAPRVLGALSRRVAQPLAGWKPLEGFLAGRSMSDGASRVSILAATIALVAAALLTIRGITASLSGEVRAWSESVATKVFVSSNSGVPRDRFEKLKAIPGVLGAESLGNWVDSPFMIRGIRGAEAGFFGPFRDPEVARRFEETESIILSTPCARALKVAVGSDVPVAVPSGAPRKLRVIAIHDELGYFPTHREFGVVSEKWMKKYFCRHSEQALSYFSLRFAPGVDPEAAATAVRSALADLPPPKVRSGLSVRDAELEDIDRDFRLFDLILGLVAILAGVSVLNALLLAAIERRKEIGVLKALGMTGDQLAGTVLIEAVVIGLIGGLLGCALGAAFAWVSVDALTRLTSLALTVEIRPSWIVTAVLGSILLSASAAFFPIARANRFRAAEAVRYE